MRRAHIEEGSALDRGTQFVIADQPAIRAMTTALGYRYHYSAEDDVYIHPAAAYVLSADGHVTRVLTGLGLAGRTCASPWSKPSEGKIGTFSDEVQVAVFWVRSRAWRLQPENLAPAPVRLARDHFYARRRGRSFVSNRSPPQGVTIWPARSVGPIATPAARSPRSLGLRQEDPARARR